MKQSARDAYDELYTYFGLRSRDGYTNGAAGGQQSGEAKPAVSANPLGDVYHLLYGDEDYNPDIRQICEKISNMEWENSKKTFCITPYKVPASNDLGTSDPWTKLPLNSSNVTGYSEQGIGKVLNDKGLYTVHALDESKFSEGEQHRVDVVQVFPVRGVPELADTDVLTLYLSTINSINMSMAVPYIDILVSTAGEGKIFEQSFSLGKFLNATGNDTSANAAFASQSESSASARAVASMEIFTSPQTAVNATPENVRYHQNSDSGRHFDIFRPFMAIESISISVVPANAGLIAFKTAQMKLRLFDRGRLADIAPIVAPARFGLVKFDIEYGWSHPGGRTKVGRQSDAQDDRIGQLIDSMRVTESYQVVNSNFSFEQDGSVSIDLKLSMLGRRALGNDAIRFTGDDADSVEIAQLLEEVQKLVSIAPKNVNVPTVLSGGIDTFININREDLKKVRKFISAAQKNSGSLKGIANSVTKLLGPSGGVGGKVAAFQKTRAQQVNAFITALRDRPDPFLRIDGLSGNGVTANEIKDLNYASLGAILTSMLGDVFQKTSDVIFVFGCFNKNAGAMYDHNIAQFPIRLRPSKNSKNQVTLQTVLEREFTKRTKITPEDLIRILNDNFLSREDTEAYGLIELYKEPIYDSNDGQVKQQSKIKIDADQPDTQLNFENKKIDNLKKIYSPDRTNPSFTLPRINIQIDCKPSSTGVGNVTRVIVTDQAATNIGDVQEMFNDITSKGFFEKENIPTPASVGAVRSAGHNDVANSVFETLEKMDIFEKHTKGSGADLLKELEASASDDALNQVKFEPEKSEGRAALEKKLDGIYFVKNFGLVSNKLRDIFYQFFPTLIYGSMGSGIISAQLSSNQNDALTTIMLQKQPNENPIQPGLPIMIHPTQLTMEVFGTPLFKYAQKFFIDFGTGTSADNFYAVTGVDMNFAPGEFKTSLKMTQLDVFGRFMKLKDTILKTVIATYRKK